MTEQFKYGDRITVSFTGTYIRLCEPFNEIIVKDLSGRYRTLYDSMNATIERNTEPEFWPPVTGDVWEANDSLYFVRKWLREKEVFMRNDFTTPIMRDRKDLLDANPRLVFRKGVKLSR